MNMHTRPPAQANVLSDVGDGGRRFWLGNNRYHADTDFSRRTPSPLADLFRDFLNRLALRLLCRVVRLQR
jgi:hypothetical protein